MHMAVLKFMENKTPIFQTQHFPYLPQVSQDDDLRDSED